MWYYKRRKDDREVIDKLNELAEKLPTRGFDTYFGRIRHEGLKWNRKRVLGVYRLLKLKLRRKRKRRLPSRSHKPLIAPRQPNMTWSADLMADSLENGRRIRVLNIIDDFNREALCIDAQHSYPGNYVVRAMEILEMERGLPKTIRVDNGPEFLSKVFTSFCTDRGIQIQYIQPGKPTQNAYVERFKRHYREDVLDAYLFTSLEQVRILSEKFRMEYNSGHPHSSLGGNSPHRYLHDKGNDSSDNVKAKMNDSLQSSTLTLSPQSIESHLGDIEGKTIFE
jgi:putative transposase